MRDFSYWNFQRQKSENRNENKCEAKVSLKKSMRLNEGLNGERLKWKHMVEKSCETKISKTSEEDSKKGAAPFKI